MSELKKRFIGSGANGQKWNFEQEVTHPSLVAILTYIYSYTNGTFTDAGKAIGMGVWNEPWANLWFMVAQAMSWLHEHGVIIDYTVDRAGFAKQLAEEFVAAYKKSIIKCKHTKIYFFTFLRQL